MAFPFLLLFPPLPPPLRRRDSRERSKAPAPGHQARESRLGFGFDDFSRQFGRREERALKRKGALAGAAAGRARFLPRDSEMWVTEQRASPRDVKLQTRVGAMNECLACCRPV